MRVVAVPVKPLSRAKTRLASALTPLERGALTLAMLEDVLDATLQVAGWQTWVVSPDEVALEQDADALAILPADLPLVTPDALHEAFHTLGSVVLARSGEGTGTSLLLRRPPRAIPARFGPDSFRRHFELAAERGLPVSVVERRELSFDLDRPDDILTLLAEGRTGRTREVCLNMDLAKRLRIHA